MRRLSTINSVNGAIKRLILLFVFHVFLLAFLIVLYHISWFFGIRQYIVFALMIGIVSGVINLVFLGLCGGVIAYRLWGKHRLISVALTGGCNWWDASYITCGTALLFESLRGSQYFASGRLMGKIPHKFSHNTDNAIPLPDWYNMVLQAFILVGANIVRDLVFIKTSIGGVVLYSTQLFAGGKGDWLYLGEIEDLHQYFIPVDYLYNKTSNTVLPKQCYAIPLTEYNNVGQVLWVVLHPGVIMYCDKYSLADVEALNNTVFVNGGGGVWWDQNTPFNQDYSEGFVYTGRLTLQGRDRLSVTATLVPLLVCDVFTTMMPAILHNEYMLSAYFGGSKKYEYATFMYDNYYINPLVASSNGLG